MAHSPSTVYKIVTREERTILRLNPDSVKTYRYEIHTPALYEEMVIFANETRLLKYKEFKSKYLQWIVEMSDLIEEEKSCLENMNFDFGKWPNKRQKDDNLTPITRKLLYSIRYYFSKSFTVKKKSPIVPDKVPKKVLKFSEKVLTRMKKWLLKYEGLSPEEIYRLFVKQCVRLVDVARETEGKLYSDKEFYSKLQKCFKNQHYIMYRKVKVTRDLDTL